MLDKTLVETFIENAIRTAAIYGQARLFFALLLSCRVSTRNGEKDYYLPDIRHCDLSVSKLHLTRHICN